MRDLELLKIQCFVSLRGRESVVIRCTVPKSPCTSLSACIYSLSFCNT